MDSHELFDHVLTHVLRCRPESVEGLKRRGYDKFKQLRDLDPKDLRTVANDGDVSIADHQEIYLFRLWCRLRRPDRAEIESMTHAEWEAVDGDDLREEWTNRPTLTTRRRNAVSSSSSSSATTETRLALRDGGGGGGDDRRHKRPRRDDDDDGGGGASTTAAARPDNVSSYDDAVDDDAAAEKDRLRSLYTNGDNVDSSKDRSTLRSLYKSAHSDDARERGRWWKMPEGSFVRRRWLCRTESGSGRAGRKCLCAQVGDELVYLPRAHREALALSGDDRDETCWYEDRLWVRCSVRGVRHVFPRRGASRRRNTVAQVLTLQLSGEVPTPRPSDDDATAPPWPALPFARRPGGNDDTGKNGVVVFDVVWEENARPQWLMTERLFSWRVGALETALAEAKGDLSTLGLCCYYHPPDQNDGDDDGRRRRHHHNHNNNNNNNKKPRLDDRDHEDNDDLWRWRTCEILSVGGGPDDDAPDAGSACGHLSVRVRRQQSGVVERLSPWDLDLLSRVNDAPPPRTLHPATKARLLRALRRVFAEEEYEEFRYSPDYVEYGNYLEEVEVPMHLSLIEKRLDTDYYSHKLSLYADVACIVRNCDKFNVAGCPIVRSARALERTFLNHAEGNKS